LEIEKQKKSFVSLNNGAETSIINK